jgi:uncharacterized membrane protein (UPF0127 family)
VVPEEEIMRAVLESGGLVIAEKVEEARTFLSRLRGLMYRQALPSGEALLIKPCDSIHTFGMRFSIDVLFLDSAGKILKAIRALKPGKVVGPVRGGTAVLEMVSGSLPTDADLEGRVVNFSG